MAERFAPVLHHAGIAHSPINAKRLVFASGAVMAFDLVILGDTPDAWSAANEAAALGRRCAVLRPDFDGGVSSGLNAVIAAFGLGGLAEHPARFRAKAPCELWRDAVCQQERVVAQLAREVGIRVLRGPARLAGKTAAEVFVSGTSHHVQGELLLIATGTTHRKRRGVCLDGDRFFVPEDVALLEETPRRLAVLGGSITATAFANLFAAAGADVTLIDPQSRPVQTLLLHNISSRVDAVHKAVDSVTIRCANGESVAADAVLCAEKRSGATATLGLAIAELEADDEGRLWCDDRGYTWQPTIAAAGEVVGFPQEIAHDREAARRLVASHFPRRIAGRIDSGGPLPPIPRRRIVSKPQSRPTASTLKLYEAIADD